MLVTTNIVTPLWVETRTTATTTADIFVSITPTEYYYCHFDTSNNTISILTSNNSKVTRKKLSIMSPVYIFNNTTSYITIFYNSYNDTLSITEHLNTLDNERKNYHV